MSDEANLVLADGTVFRGLAFGARGTTVGEAVFTTTMSGYQEVLTDPSYCGQIVVMTAPEIGNVGTNDADTEAVGQAIPARGSRASSCADASPIASSWRAEKSLDAYLEAHGVVAIRDVDTRKLTRHLRDHGAQNAAIGTAPVAELLRAARAAPDMNGLDLVSRVTPKEPYRVRRSRAARGRRRSAREPSGDKPHVVCMDFGMKRNILRCLVDAGLPRHRRPREDERARRARALARRRLPLERPGRSRGGRLRRRDRARTSSARSRIFGICLGHQLLALALGGKTYKLKFGHRGANQPVKDLATGRIEITTQNHGFCVDLDVAPEVRAVYTHPLERRHERRSCRRPT